MKPWLFLAAAFLVIMKPANAKSNFPTASLTAPELQAVAPALERYRQEVLLGDLWKRPDLSARDRGVVTLSVLIARGQAIEMPFYFSRALDDGVQPGEVSEIITHLAFYSGWANATLAATVARDVFAARGIGADQLPAASPKLLPLDAAAEAKRAATVQENTGPASPGLVQFTGDVLFKELWLRPGLAPRDRGLVTVSALIASAQTEQITFHLNRALDNGLTRAQASEALAHAAFYAGWPNAFSAAPVFRKVFESRPK